MWYTQYSMGWKLLTKSIILFRIEPAVLPISLARSLVNTVASSILYILFASVLSYFSCAIIYFFSPTMLTWNLLLHLQHEYLTTRVVLFISKAFSSNHRLLLWIDLISPPFPPKIYLVSNSQLSNTYCELRLLSVLYNPRVWDLVHSFATRTSYKEFAYRVSMCCLYKCQGGSRAEVNTRGEVWNVCAKNGVSLTLNTITVITWSFNQRYLLLFSCFQLFYWGSGCFRTQTSFPFSMNIDILVTNHRNQTSWS